MAYCQFNLKDSLGRDYHEEWGTPIHEDQQQFEHLSMEVMQCGLSFRTVLVKREILRQCFSGFAIDKVAAFTENDVERIMETQGMIHAVRKIRAIINNAKRVQEVQNEFGSFAAYLWSFTDGKVVCYQGHEKGRIPASNGLSLRISKDLKKRGFTFVGPIVIYSHLQACGIINDHDGQCPRRQAILKKHVSIQLSVDAEQDVRQF